MLCCFILIDYGLIFFFILASLFILVHLYNGILFFLATETRAKLFPRSVVFTFICVNSISIEFK